MANYYQGKFKPKHPEKYEGDPTNIFYRSSWERKFMLWCDTTSSVVKWSSEEVVIPYICPTDNRPHRYFPDALIKVKDANGNIKVYLIEIKPFKQTLPPQQPKRKTKQYITEVMTWGKNDAKWKAARQYCADRNYEFKLITEYDLGIAKKPNK